MKNKNAAKGQRPTQRNHENQHKEEEDDEDSDEEEIEKRNAGPSGVYRLVVFVVFPEKVQFHSIQFIRPPEIPANSKLGF